jgi:hypothetical protein
MTDIAESVRYQSKRYDCNVDYPIYIRYDGTHFLFCEVDTATGYDHRQGVARAAAIPSEAQEAAKALWRNRQSPSYVGPIRVIPHD